MGLGRCENKKNFKFFVKPTHIAAGIILFASVIIAIVIVVGPSIIFVRNLTPYNGLYGYQYRPLGHSEAIAACGSGGEQHYDCVNNSCEKVQNGQYTDSNCLGQCTQQQRYGCSSNNACVQMQNGSYTDPNCNNQCTAPPTIISVTIESCTPDQIQPNGTSNCTAIVQGTGNFDPTVTWSTDIGTIQSTATDTALYTAPGNSGTATITAKSKQDPTKEGTATITITKNAPPPENLTVALSINNGGGEGLATYGDFLLTVVDTTTGDTLLDHAVAKKSQVVTMSQGDGYTVTENTTANSSDYMIAYDPNGTCTGSLSTATTCNITNTYAGPTFPTNLTATPVSSSEIDLTWTASTDNDGTIAGYEVFRDNVQVATATDVSFKDMGLQTSTTYTYQITAFDTNGFVSQKSNTAKATTMSGGGGGGGGNSQNAGFFGLHTNVAGDGWPTVNFATWRSHDSSSNWVHQETCDPSTDPNHATNDPANICYTWTTLDMWLSRMQPSQDALFTIYETPSWASSYGASSTNPDTECGTQKFGPGICDAPSDIAKDGAGTDKYLKDYLTALLKHLSSTGKLDQIKYYEIWNEPNVQAEWNWGLSTNAQMLRMAKDSRTVIKSYYANNSQVVPLFTTPAVSAVQTMNSWIAKYLAGGGGQYADIMAIHGYANNGIPENIMSVDVNVMHKIMQKYGQDSKPLFVTEGRFDTFIQSEDQRAAFVARYYILPMAAGEGGAGSGIGAQKLFWYDWTVGQNSQNDSALYDRNTQQLNKVGVAYQQVYTWASAATFSGPCTVQGTQYTCALTGANGYQGLILWDTAATYVCTTGCPTHNVQPPQGYVQYRDLDGNVNQIRNNRVPIGAKPILLENQNP